MAFTTTPFPHREARLPVPSGGIDTGVKSHATYATKTEIGQDTTAATRLGTTFLDYGRARAVRERVQLELSHMANAHRQRGVARDILVRPTEQFIGVHCMARGHVPPTGQQVQRTAYGRLAEFPCCTRGRFPAYAQPRGQYHVMAHHRKFLYTDWLKGVYSARLAESFSPAVKESETSTGFIHHIMDPAFSLMIKRSRALCPYMKSMPPAKLGMLMRQYTQSHGSSSPIVQRACQCPYMSQSVATSARSDENGEANATLSAGGSAPAAPHPLSKSWLERHSGRTCPVGNHSVASLQQKRTYATQTKGNCASVAATPASVANAPLGSMQAAPFQKRTPGSGLGRLPTPAPQEGPGFDFEQFYHKELTAKHDQKTYRYFNNINRLAGKAPMGHLADEANEITVWCSNDYQNMSRHPRVLAAVKETVEKYGAGAGGTRNIAGHNQHVERIESVLARLHRKEGALVFGSCYAANDATLSVLGSKLPNCVILSDSSNHASMIQGIKHSGAKKMIYKHNDMEDLEAKLRSLPIETPKIIAFESVYSMCGTVGPIEKTIELAKKYGAITFLDEVHAVGMYGPHGAGVAEHLDWMLNATMPPGKLKGTIMDSIDIITGTLGKAYGNVGGYIAGSNRLVDLIRSFAPQFIFSTTLPPAVLSGAATAIEVLMESNHTRQLQQIRTRELKNALLANNIPLQSNPSHIVPVLVGSAEKAKMASDLLLNQHGCYVQPINYPTVGMGLERLRVTPTPEHSSQHVAHLVNAMKQVWQQLGLRTVSDLLAAPRDGSDPLADLFRRSQFEDDTSPLWSDAMLTLPSDMLRGSSSAAFCCPCKATPEELPFAMPVGVQA